MRFELPPLPYATHALEPHISARTLEFHYEKHHQDYMKKLKAGIEGTPDEQKTLEQLIQTCGGSIFNNAAQVWNHTFYWNSMSPDGGGTPNGSIAVLIESDFRSLDNFIERFSAAAIGEFGSGWAWLIKRPDGHLDVINSSDAENPLQRGLRPLLTIDVWEHAYYLDYQNERGKYIQAFVKELINWDFAARNLG
ncbi:MAG: superoxide dismutase [Gammaproteobacteria bacterium]